MRVFALKIFPSPVNPARGEGPQWGICALTMGRWGDGDREGWGWGLPQKAASGVLVVSPGRQQIPGSACPGSICCRVGVNNHRMEQGFVEGKSWSTVGGSLLSLSLWPWLLPSIFGSGPSHAHQASTALPDPLLRFVCSSFLPASRVTCSNSSPF